MSDAQSLCAAVRIAYETSGRMTWPNNLSIEEHFENFRRSFYDLQELLHKLATIAAEVEREVPSRADPASVPAQVMQVLDLLLDVAYHDGTARELAVAAEAYTLAGYHDGAIMVSHSGRREDLLEAVAAARRGRPKRLLKHDAQGMFDAVRTLVCEGVVEGRDAMLRTNARWKERGGHERVA